MSSNPTKSPFTKEKRIHKKSINDVSKVKSSSKSQKAPKLKTKHKKKRHNHTAKTKITSDPKPSKTHNQPTISSNENNTTNVTMQNPSRPRLSKKVSKIYFDAYRKLPQDQQIYESEENKQPKDLPSMKLLEAIHGISSHYANENNPQIEGLLDTPALLCLGILVEEYTKHCTTDYMEKFEMASSHFDQHIPQLQGYHHQASNTAPFQ